MKKESWFVNKGVFPGISIIFSGIILGFLGKSAYKKETVFTLFERMLVWVSNA